MSEIKSEKEFLELLPILAQNNADANTLAKEVAADKTRIKEYMLAEDIEEAESGGWSITCSESIKRSMDEGKLLEIIQELIKNAKGVDKDAFSNLIIMKPVINEQLLEDLIYEERIAKELIEPAVVEAVSYTLRFKKVKKKAAAKKGKK